MAKKYELITELYERTRQSVTEPQQWQRFLSTVCRNYRLSFDEQLLLFAQRPDATGSASMSSFCFSPSARTPPPCWRSKNGIASLGAGSIVGRPASPFSTRTRPAASA